MTPEEERAILNHNCKTCSDAIRSLLLYLMQSCGRVPYVTITTTPTEEPQGVIGAFIEVDITFKPETRSTHHG